MINKNKIKTTSHSKFLKKHFFKVSTAASLPDNRLSSAMTISDSSFVWNDEFDFLDLKKWKQTASASSIDNSFQYFSGNPENRYR